MVDVFKKRSSSLYTIDEKSTLRKSHENPYVKEVYKEFFVKIIPIVIVAITFCFMGWMPISSFGMVMFWGIVLMAIYNSIVTNSLLKINEGKDK